MHALLTTRCTAPRRTYFVDMKKAAHLAPAAQQLVVYGNGGDPLAHAALPAAPAHEPGRGVQSILTGSIYRRRMMAGLVRHGMHRASLSAGVQDQGFVKAR